MSKSKRELLQGFIESGDLRHFPQFLSAANPAFKPVGEDFNHYLDEEGYFSKFQKLGQIEYKDGSRLLIAAIQSDRELTGHTGKKKQYDLGKKVLKDTYSDGGLFLFYDTEGKFRLSFIYAQYHGSRRTFSTFRRYTYFISPELHNKTFLNQVGRCDFAGIDNILAAFSIDAVSDEFYNEFKPRFDQIAQAVEGLSRKNISLQEDFALLFAIRIIFLGFVQKKGWLGGNVHFVQDFWTEYKKQSNGKNQFYDRWLIPLFFEALNSPPGRKVKWQNNEFSPETEKILQMAPYLNGELFKPKQGVDSLELTLPDEVIGEFIDWLFTWNFTIEENDCYDEELELNPEFLGIIFERLVNKADGAVYTPRTEVDLMCRMALVKWLEKNSACNKKDLYELLFREGGLSAEYEDCQKSGSFSEREIRQLISLLETVAVCDPAAGSGAFEVGMLHVLNETIQTLQQNPFFPKDLTPKDPYERKKAIIGNCLYGVEVKRWAVWINQLRLWLTLFIDMPDEMKMSLTPLLPSLNFKIRRGDSLIQRIGKKLFPVHGHADVTESVKRKITELKKAKLDFFYNRGMDEGLVKQMEYKVFEAIIHSQIEEINKLIERRMSNTDKGASGPQLSLLEQVNNVAGRQKKLLDGTKPIGAIRDIQLDNHKRELQDELEKLAKDKEHPLVWNIEFSEIFYDKGGFDIIIGNPPYVRQEDIADPEGKVNPKEYKELLCQMAEIDYPKHFKDRKIDGHSDLYTFFYLRGLRLLNNKGVHVFICSNSWLDVGYGIWMQEFLLNYVPIHFIIDNHARRSFASSDVNTIISILGAPISKPPVDETHIVKFVAFKRPFEDAVFTETLLQLEATTGIDKNDLYRVYPITSKQLYDEGMDEENRKYIGDKWGGKYLRAPDIFFTILQKGKDKLVKLKEVADVRFGIKTGCNEYFYLTDAQARNWNIEDEYLIPVIKSPRECLSIIISPDKLQYKIFICNKSKQELKGTNAIKYIEWGEKLKIQIKQGKDKGKTIIGVNNLSFVKKRKRWWSVDEIIGNSFWGKELRERLAVFVSLNNMACDCRLYTTKLSKELRLFCNSTIYHFFGEVLKRDLGGGGGPRSVMVLEVKNSFVLKPELINCSVNLPAREILPIFEEIGLNPESEVPLSVQEPKPRPDRKELDDIVFDALNLSADERKDVYRAVCQLVWNRISKAKSVKKRK